MFEWDCVLQSEDGNTVSKRFSARWSPEKDFITSESIANACAAEAFRASGRKMRFVGISAQLVTA